MESALGIRQSPSEGTVMSNIRRPAATGVLGAVALIGLYLGIVRFGSNSWPHAVELLLTDWYLVAAVATGFGIQIGLFTHLRRLLRANGGVRSATAMAAGGTATSTTSMVACCLHHLADVLPVIGLSGAAVFFTTYKVPVILFGLATNALGIGMMIRTIRRHSRMECAQEGRTDMAPGTFVETAGKETLQLQITGMSCASCVASIEGAVGNLPGIVSVAVNLNAGTGRVEYDPATVTPLQIKRTIRDLGYDAAERLEGTAALDREREARQREIVTQGRWMLIAWPLALVVMLGTFQDVWILPRYVPKFFGNPLLLFGLTTPIVFGPVWQFFVNSYRGLRHGVADMNLLYATGIGAAYLIAVINTFW